MCHQLVWAPRQQLVWGSHTTRRSPLPAEQIPFTKDALSALPSAPAGKRAYYRDTRYPQLYIQITDRGRKSFQVYSWGAGRPQRVTLGKFDPENPGALTIEQARKEVAGVLKKIQAGRRPNAEKRATRHAETVRDMASEYLKRHAKEKKRSWREDERQIEKDINPVLGSRKAREITRRDITKLLERISDRGADVQARRTYRLLSRMFRYAVGKGLSDGKNFVFPSPRGDHPICKDALSRAVSRNLKAFGVEDFTPHDLRRTASTIMAEAGVSDFDIRRVQGHALPGTGKVYNQYSFDSEKRRALSRWSRRLDEILSGKKRGKVVGLPNR